MVVILLSSLLNAILFFRVVERAYLEPREEEAYALDGGSPTVTMDRLPLGMTSSMALLALGLLLLGIFTGQIVEHVIRFCLPAF